MIPCRQLLTRGYAFLVAYHVTLGSGWLAAAETDAAQQHYQRAISAYHDGKVTEARQWLDQAIDENPAFIEAYLARGYLHQYERQYQAAAEAFGEVIRLDPSRPEPWFRRAIEHFNLGQFEKSVLDFEAFAKLEPAQKPHLWQLGIAYFYTGQFREGKELFESHQEVNTQDVENAVWHFLCVAALEGFEAARSQFIAIQGDARTPMKEVWALFKGIGSDEAVIKAARAENMETAQRLRADFYANLYLGLYYQSKSEETKALDFMNKAAKSYKNNGYMGEVARVHRDWILARKSASASPPQP